MSAHCTSLAGDSLLELERRVEGFEGIAELDEASIEDSGARCTQMGGEMAQDAGSRYMHIVLTGSGCGALGYRHARRQRHWAPVYLSQEETSLVFAACASGAYGCH